MANWANNKRDNVHHAKKTGVWWRKSIRHLTLILLSLNTSDDKLQTQKWRTGQAIIRDNVHHVQKQVSGGRLALILLSFFFSLKKKTHCWSRSAGFWWNHLIRIYNVVLSDCKYMLTTRMLQVSRIYILRGSRKLCHRRSTFDNVSFFFCFSLLGEKIFKCHYKRSFIGPPANAV